jgi:hypothetical protein
LNSKLPSERQQQLALNCWIIRQTESNQAAALLMKFQGEEVMVCHVITTCEYAPILWKLWKI